MCKPLVFVTSLAMVLNILVPVIRPVPAQARPVASPPHEPRGSEDRPSRVLRPLTGATAWIEGPHAPAVLSPTSSISISAAEAAIGAPTVPVSITESGFDPATVTVTAGGTVEWTNRTHETVHLVSGEPYRIYLPLVVRNTGATGATAASPPVTAAFTAQQQDDWANVDIAPGESYVHTFTTTGNHPYFLAGYPDRTGLVVVQRAYVPDFALAVVPDLRTVTQGQSVTYTAALTAMDGFTAPVALSVLGLPAGAAPAWSANPVTPAGSAVLTVTTATSTPTGTHNITVSGTGGGRTHDVLATLIVEPLPRPDFVLDAWPATQTLTCGLGISYTVAVTAVDGFAQAVTLDVGGAPAGAAIAWATNPLTPTADTTLAITPSVSGPFGPFTLVITGTAGIVHTRQVGLVVVEPCIPLPDLVIEDITFVPDVPFTDETVTGTVTVRNQGDAPARPFRADWYVDPASPPGAGETGDGYWELPGLDVGATAKLTLTHSFATAGNHQLYAQVDTMDAVIEIPETNNVDGEPLAVVDQIEGACGDIVTDTTWYPGTLYHVTCDVRVLEGVTLTLEPGVVVQFGNSDGMIVNGALVADGAAMAPIRLTADTDVPSPGYWDGVRFGISSENSILSHVTIEYAGNTSTAYASGLYLESDQVTVAHSHVRLNWGYGLRVAAGASPTITSTTFTSNTSYAAYVSYASSSPSNPLFVNSAGSGNGYDGIQVSGTISGTVHWTANANFPYIVYGGLTVDEGASLTLDPTTVLKFENSASRLTVRGTLTADADAGSEIIFTSLQDDGHGGDTHNDRGITTPGPGDWNQILVEGGTATLDHVVIRYGAGGSYADSCGMLRNEGDLSLTNSDVSYSAYTGLCHDGVGAIVDGCIFAHNGHLGGWLTINSTASPAQLTNNVFNDNGSYAARIYYYNNRTVSTANNTGSGNGYDGIQVSGTISGTVHWTANANFPYIVYGGLTVDEGASLTLDPTTVLKFENSASRLTVRGTLTADADAGSEIIFTSLQDDGYGGDTHNDRGTTTPGPRDWNQILVEGGTATLDHVVIRYGAGGSYADSCGMLRNEGDLVLINSDVSFSLYDGLCTRGTSVTISGNSFHGNVRYGVYNVNTSVQVNAENNWWGSYDGPDPYGSGDGINYRTCYRDGTPYVCEYYVDADPWIGKDYWDGNIAGQDVPWVGYTADPVNTANGNYTCKHADLSIPTRGDLRLDFVRSYNAIYPQDGPLGYGWSHSYGISVSEVVTEVFVSHADGRQDRFVWNGSTYEPNPGTFSTLVKQSGTFTLTLKDRTIYAFDALGRLARVLDRNGNALVLSYTGNRLSTVTAPGGLALAFDHDPNGHITRVTDPIGRSIGFTYSISGDLTVVTDTQGVTTFTYDDDHRLLTATDANGATSVHNSYDDQGRVVAQRDALGNPTTFAYYEFDHITAVTDPLGHTTTHEYDGDRRLITQTNGLGGSVVDAYDAYNNRTASTDERGFTTRYAYDERGNPTVITDALGTTTTMRYDAQDNLLRVTDARGYSTLYEYDTHGNLITRTDALSGTLVNALDEYGQIVSRVDEAGNTTRFGYDLYGHRTVVTNALGYAARQVVDPAGRLIAETDALGHTTTYAYDAANHTVAVTNTLNQVTRSAYDPIGHQTAVTDATGVAITYTYDLKGRLIAESDGAGHLTHYGYDALDRRVVMTDALGYTTRYEYDALSHLVAITDALGGTTRYTYDAAGNRTSVTDANGNTTRYGFDALGRTVAITDGLGGVTRYGFDGVGNCVVITDANSHVTTMGYDPLNRLVWAADPLSRTVRHSYDPLGHVTVITRADGTAIAQTYDSLGQVTLRSTPDGTIAYQYDALGSRVAMTDTTGTTRYTYDGLGQLLNVAQPGSVPITYAYDAAGNRTHLTYPGGRVVTYTYGAAHRLMRVTDWASRAVSYTYDALGRPVAQYNPNGTTVSFEHDALDRAVAITHESTVSGTFGFFRYAYDAVGNRTVMTDSLGATGYQYDALYRVSGVDYPDGESVTYAYDAMGNRLALTSTVHGTVTYTYDAADQLLASGPITFAWDLNGNLIARSGVSYTWDDLNRLAAVVSKTDVVSGTDVVTFTYNGDGARVARSVNGAATTTVQDVGLPLPYVLEEADGSGTTRYVYGLDMLAHETPAGAPFHYHHDALGSTRHLSNQSGQAVAGYAYDAFGAVRWTQGSAGTEFTFAGEQADPATGLYFLRARYYDPALGRFISRDPCPGDVAQPWTLNRYVYCANNPVNSSPAPTAAGRAGCTTHPGPAARSDRRPRGCVPPPAR